MNETKEQLRRGVGHFEPMPDAFDRVLGRRERRERNRRIRAGALGVIVALATGIILVRSMTSNSIPADQPVEPRPVPSGALTYALDGDIYVADPDGLNPVKISEASADPTCEGMSMYSNPSWSPDGRYVAFERDCTNPDQRDVVITDPHGNVVVRTGPSYGWGLTWSPDSTRVAVWKTMETLGVYGVDGERQAMPMPPVTGGGNDAAPRWMPDGSALLVFGYAVVPLDESAGYELSLGGQATYSPDGTRVAVFDNHDSVVVYDADGSRVSEVDARLAGPVEAWSPVGDRFAALSHGELIVVEVASGTVTVLTKARAALDDGDEILEVRGFSPEGDRILYEAVHSNGVNAPFSNPGLWSVGVDGSDARLLVAGTIQGDWRSR